MSARVRPPIPYDVVENLIQEIEAGDPTLGRIVKMAYHAGLKKSQIISLTVGEALRMLEGARLGSNLPAVRETVQGQLAYLRQHNLPHAGDAPLFPPDVRGTRYHVRQLTRRMNTFIKNYPCSPNLDKIRQSGICRYYEDLGGSDPLDHNGSLNDTVRFGQVTPRQTQDILRGTIQYSGAYRGGRSLNDCSRCQQPCRVMAQTRGMAADSTSPPTLMADPSRSSPGPLPDLFREPSAEPQEGPAAVKPQDIKGKISREDLLIKGLIIPLDKDDDGPPAINLQDEESGPDDGDDWGRPEYEDDPYQDI